MRKHKRVATGGLISLLIQAPSPPRRLLRFLLDGSGTGSSVYEAYIFLSVLESNRVERMMTRLGKTRLDGVKLSRERPILLYDRGVHLQLSAICNLWQLHLERF